VWLDNQINSCMNDLLTKASNTESPHLVCSHRERIDMLAQIILSHCSHCCYFEIHNSRDRDSDTARHLSATVVNGRGIAPLMQVMRHSSHSSHVFAGNLRWAVFAEIRVCLPRSRRLKEGLLSRACVPQ